MKKTAILFFLSLILFCCSNPGNPAISKIDINGHVVTLLSYSEITDTTPAKLSDLADNLHFIPLETKEECIIGYAHYYVYDKYIIVVNPYEKILLFTGKGKFLRQIAQAGKGPQEFQNAVTTVDENNDILYVGDESKSYFMSWDLNTGDYLGDIPRVYEGKLKNMLFTSNNTLLCAPVVGHNEAGRFYVFEQDTEGNLIRAIEAPERKSWHDSQDKLLHFNGYGYNYIPIKIDTIFQVKDSVLAPSWVVDFGKNNDKLIGKTGGRSFTYSFESNRFFAGRVYTLEKVETTIIEGGTSTRTSGKSENLIVDKESGNIFLNEKLENDFIAESIYLYWINVLPNNTLYIAKSAISLIEHAEKVIEDPDTHPEIKSRLKNLLDQIDLEDNPILIVGKLRK